jgi:Carbohydrate esterase, sialic acid-specific acetylesterase
MVMKKLLFGSFIVFAFCYGVAVGRYKIFPYRIVKETKHLVAAIASPSLIVIAHGQVSEEQTIRSIDANYSDVSTKQKARGDDDDYSDVSNKQEIPCSALGMRNTMVALTFGQSNSANYGETRYTPARSVYNFYEGKCYKAADPLLGATGDKGSVWTRLGDMLIDNGLYSHVIFVTIGAGGTSVSRWTTNGDLFQRIVKTKSQLDQQNLQLTHLLWHQGESDGKIGTEKDDYKMMLVDMLDGIRHLGINAPLYLAIATRCEGPIRKDIHEAQLELVEERGDIVMGANTDTLSDMDDRYDFCHFSDTGLQKHAALWRQSIQKGESEKHG